MLATITYNPIVLYNFPFDNLPANATILTADVYATVVMISGSGSCMKLLKKKSNQTNKQTWTNWNNKHDLIEITNMNEIK